MRELRDRRDRREHISCMLVDVMRQTLATCDYRECDEKCTDYLMEVGLYCPVVFNNEQYASLWNTLYTICNEIGEQTSPFYLDE
jgi:hypothetical protein